MKQIYNIRFLILSRKFIIDIMRHADFDLIRIVRYVDKNVQKGACVPPKVQDKYSQCVDRVSYMRLSYKFDSGIPNASDVCQLSRYRNVRKFYESSFHIYFSSRSRRQEGDFELFCLL